jgi:D-alanyl-D-alanine dipeptidase
VGLAPNFEDEARKTEGRGIVHWENTDPKLKPAADKLVALIKGKRGTAYIESAWRPQEYQDHLYDVWTTNGELMKDTNPACDELRKIVKNEIELHHLGGVVGQHSPHTSGIAVDIPFSLTNGDIDELANSVGLWRPLFQTYPGERDHFELKQLKPYNCLCTHCNYSWSSNSPPTSCLRCGSSEVVCN